MYCERLKDYIYSEVINEGYSMNYVYPTVASLDKLISFALSAKEELLAEESISQSKDIITDKLEYLLYKLEKLVNNDNLGWDEKYNKCWCIKDDMFELTSFEWYDPDMGYEEDVMAFYRAAKENIGDE